MYQFPPTFVLFDLEYTAWEGSSARSWSGPGEHREIIQIGAIRATATDFLAHESFDRYVRPRINPILSEYIVALTGITQRDVDERGVAFVDAYEQFRVFVAETPAFCWGKDVEVLEENLQLQGMPVTLPTDQFQNLKPLLASAFEQAGIDLTKYHSGTLIEAFGKPPERRAHNAVNDMRNLLDAIAHLGNAARRT